MSVKFLGKRNGREVSVNRPRVTLAGVQDAGIASSLVNGTPTQRLASLLLQQPVEDWITSKRDAGVSWRLIARELHTVTDGQIDVTAETLRGWFALAA